MASAGTQHKAIMFFRYHYINTHTAMTSKISAAVMNNDVE